MKAQVRSISVSAMPFNHSNTNRATEQQSSRAAEPFKLFEPFKPFNLLLYCATALFCSVLPASAELIDRVIAYVDDTAITLREFNKHYEKTIKIKHDISKEEVLNTLINRTLLLREAKKLKIEATTEDELLNEYIDLKVKAFIRIREEDIRGFYDSNTSEFRGLSYESVRDKIEDYLVQLEVNRLLKRHLSELRANSYIKILD